jgi:sulfide:quinone oxidoreductase
VASIDTERKTAVLDDGTELPFGIFLGVPKHVAPPVVVMSGLTDNGWITVDRKNLMTKFPDVYAVGDITSVGTAKAGVFAEGAARVAAASILARLAGKENEAAYDGVGSCYLEFGEGKVARVDVDFFSGPKPIGVHNEASTAITAEKVLFGTDRVARWFGA